MAIFTFRMNLAIDIGNTRIKWARFNQRSIIESGVIANYATDGLRALFSLHAADSISVSSVVELDETLSSLFRSKNAFIIDHSTELPIRNSYNTPNTLGMDRLCAAIGAWSLYSGNPILAIDIGTCIKYEFLSNEGEYIGGNISPGLRMRFSSLNDHTSKLPRLEPDMVSGPIGRSTTEALRLGVQQGMLFEIQAMIAAMRALHPDLKTVATGGDLPFFVNDLKTHIFADLLLVLRGINEIYLHNT